MRGLKDWQASTSSCAANRLDSPLRYGSNGSDGDLRQGDPSGFSQQT